MTYININLSNFSLDIFLPKKYKSILDRRGMNILDFIRFENYYCQIHPDFRTNLNSNVTNHRKIAQRINVSRMTVSRIINQENYWCNFQTLKNLSHQFNIPTREIYNNIIRIKTKNSFPIEFHIQELISPAFFRVIGHILGDGGIHVIEEERKYRAFYVNNEHVLLNSFCQDVYNLFGDVKIYKRERELHGDEIWLPTTIGYFLYCIMQYNIYDDKRVPAIVMNSKDKELIAFTLQAIFDDDGSVSPTKHEIVMSMARKDLVCDIAYLLRKIGVKHNKIRKIIPKNRSIMYRFSITSRSNILEFGQKVNFTHPKKKEKLQYLIKKYRGR